MWWVYFVGDDDFAAGTRLGVVDLFSPISVAGSWLVGGGVALYLAATALFRWAMSVGAARPRLATTVSVALGRRSAL